QAGRRSFAVLTTRRRGGLSAIRCRSVSGTRVCKTRRGLVLRVHGLWLWLEPARSAYSTPPTRPGLPTPPPFPPPPTPPPPPPRPGAGASRPGRVWGAGRRRGGPCRSNESPAAGDDAAELTRQPPGPPRPTARPLPGHPCQRDSEDLRGRRAVAGGRRTSFEDFVLARGQALQRFGYLLTSDWELAEYLVRTAFPRAYSRWPRLKIGAREAHLRKIMINTWSSWWRGRWRAALPAEVLPDVATADQHARAERGQAVTSALAGLPQRQRLVLVLRFHEDLSQPQVAELLAPSGGPVE